MFNLVFGSTPLSLKQRIQLRITFNTFAFGIAALVLKVVTS